MTASSRKRTRFLKIVLFTTLILAGLVILFVVGVSLYAASALTRFEPKPVISNPSEYGMAYEDITLMTSDGLTLSGWWIAAKGSSRVVIMVHGSEGNRSRPPEKMLGIARELHDHRYSVLMFDMRGHGESDAEHVSAGLNERFDLLAAVDYAKQQGMRRVGVIGFSLGAATSLMTLTETEEIDSVVSDSGYADLTDIIRSEFDERSSLPRFFIPTILFTAKVLYKVDFKAVKPIEAVRKSDVPVFIIHGMKDAMVPVEHAYRLAKVFRNPASGLWVLPDSGHSNSYLVRPEEYMKRVLAFFEEILR